MFSCTVSFASIVLTKLNDSAPSSESFTLKLHFATWFCTFPSNTLMYFAHALTASAIITAIASIAIIIATLAFCFFICIPPNILYFYFNNIVYNVNDLFFDYFLHIYGNNISSLFYIYMSFFALHNWKRVLTVQTAKFGTRSLCSNCAIRTFF